MIERTKLAAMQAVAIIPVATYLLVTLSTRNFGNFIFDF